MPTPSSAQNIISYKTPCFATKFGEIPAYTFSMKVSDLVDVSYVAVRGVDEEEGAVQRVLSKARIAKIRSYILDGNTFFNSFILNWTDKTYPVRVNEGKINIPLVTSSAQVIDGQHRITGLEEAMKEDATVGERDIIVTLCTNLTTPQAAGIFLNINTEQRPVPKSLIFDLFGEVEGDPAHAINRATDIAESLNEDPLSPLYKLIKFPGAPRGVGRIELSTFVTALKKHLEKDGEFSRVKLKSLDAQKAAVFNFFAAIRSFYEPQKVWQSQTGNPFFRAAGFNGAVDFLCDKLLLKCAERKSFTVETMRNVLRLDEYSLLTWDDLQGTDGKTARKKVAEYLSSSLTGSLADQDEYEF
ncbi:DGQHR domain-containing protein [Sphingomonas sp.]|uniref:DGQHR domain-containing protein n=1 Tax=Sphingomonas sp. TaxID=28214 RepID=UPI0035BC927B